MSTESTAEVRPPTDRPGWFEVVFSVRDGDAVARHAYRYLVLPPSAVRNPWTGVCTHFVQAGRPGRAHGVRTHQRPSFRLLAQTSSELASNLANLGG